MCTVDGLRTVRGVYSKRRYFPVCIVICRVSRTDNIVVHLKKHYSAIVLFGCRAGKTYARVC